MANVPWTDRIRTEQLRLTYRNYPFTLSANFGLSLLVIAALWGDVTSSLLLGWGAFSAALTTKGTWDYLRHRHTLSAPTPASVDKASQRFREIAWSTGLMWGCAGMSPYLITSAPVQQIVFPAITGMAFGGAAFLSTSRRLFYGYIVPMLGLTFVGAAGMDGNQSMTLASLTLALAFATLAFAYNVHAMIMRSLVLRFENMDLIDALKLQKEQADSANFSKSRFLAAASHDLRQPMHALGLLFESLRPHVQGAASRQLLHSISETIYTLEDLFNALLDISRLDAGVVPCELQPVPLQRTLARIATEFRPVAEIKGLRFVLRIPNHESYQNIHVHSDPALLDRLLRNLVSNAIQHTQEGTVLVACRLRACSVQLEVRDSGPGIPPELHQEIFQEFYQIHNAERDRSHGVGLGLAIVQRVSRILHHPVHLRSHPGCGTTFVIEIPRLMAHQQPTPTHQTLANDGIQSLIGRRVAAIDDDPIVLEGMRQLLQHWGCVLTTAGSVNELLEKLAFQGAMPEVVISDYRLRNGEDGAKAITKIAAFCNQPVHGVLITGDTAPERLREASHSGYIVLHKPVRPSKLRALLLHLLHDKVSSPAPRADNGAQQSMNHLRLKS